MRVAVTSQNRLTVTGHAGRCQRFWIYDIEGQQVRGRTLVEVAQEQTFHAGHHATPPGLEDIQVFITGGMGQGLAGRLEALGVKAVVTTETDLDRAIAGFLAGTLPQGQPHAHGAGHQH